MVYWGLPTRGARSRSLAAAMRSQWAVLLQTEYRNGKAAERAVVSFLVELYRTWDAIRETNGMPRKKQQMTEWRGFVDFRLEGEDKAAYLEWLVSEDELYERLVYAIEGGHKFTVAYNPQTDTFSASFTGSAAAGPNVGLTLSAFGPDWITATRVLVYKHTECAGGDWSALRASERAQFG